MSTKKHVVFDIVGTCVSYDSWMNAIESRLGDRLRAEGIKPQLFCFAWLETAEREYTYLSLSGRYSMFTTVQRALFWRVLFQSGIAKPREFATEEDLDVVMDGYDKLTVRDGIPEAFKLLRDNGWTIWALTAGDRKRTRGYFEKAGVHFPEENFLSCDDSKIGKPEPRAYLPALERLGKDDIKWFGAAHMWDVTAATTVGFKGAYCSVWEGEPLTEVFGSVDVMATTPLEMAQKMVEATA